MANMEFLRSARGRVVDDLLMLKANGTVATDGMVGESPLGTDTYYDTGGGRTRGDMVVNVYSLGSNTPWQSVTFRLQGSKNSSFTTGTDLAVIKIGTARARNLGVGTLATALLGEGRYIVPFTNDLDGTVYRYLRHYMNETFNTGATGVQYECYLSNIIT